MKRFSRSERLLAACRSQDHEEQYEAIISLSQHYPDIAPKMLVELLTSPEFTIRWKAASLLGTLGRKDITIVGPALIQTLEDSEQLVRDEATKSLINLGYPLPKKLLVSRLHDDPDWRGRSTAAEAMGDLNDVTVLPELEEALQKETTPAVRASIVRSIGLLASSEYLPKLEPYFSVDSAPAVQRELFAACYRLGDQTKLEPLLLLLKEVDAKTA